MTLLRALLIALLWCSIVPGGAWAQGTSGPGGMSTSGSNATSAALGNIATAAGDANLAYTDVGQTFTQPQTTTGYPFSVSHTATGTSQPIQLTGPTLATSNEIAMFVGATFNSANNGGTFGFDNNGGTGSATNAMEMSVWGSSGKLSINGSGNVTANGLATTGTIAGSICSTSGGLILYESGATGCTISLSALKNIKGPITLAEAHATLAAIPVDFSMKPRDGEKVNTRPQLGFTAEGVASANAKCSTYDGKGKLQGYEPNCLLAAAYVVIKNQGRRIARLEKHFK